jgi:hypothetical protein
MNLLYKFSETLGLKWNFLLSYSFFLFFQGVTKQKQ